MDKKFSLFTLFQSFDKFCVEGKTFSSHQIVWKIFSKKNKNEGFRKSLSKKPNQIMIITFWKKQVEPILFLIYLKDNSLGGFKLLEDIKL